MSDVVCPKCGCSTGAGRFCPSCGERLPRAAASGAVTDASAKAAPPVAAKPSGSVAMPFGEGAGKPSVPVSGALPPLGGAISGDFTPPRMDPLPAPPTLPSLPPLAPLATPGASPSDAAVSPASASKDPFSLTCSLPERFVEGMTAVILLKVKRNGGVKSKEKTRISLVEGDRILAGPVERRGNLGVSGPEIPLNFRPEHAGSLSVQIRIESYWGDSSEAEVRLATLILPVEPAGGHGSGGLSIQINNDGGLVDFQSPGLAERIGAAGKDYVATTSNPRRFRPVEGLALLATPTRITLAVGETRFHAVSRRPAWFGRRDERPEKGRLKDNAIALRVFSPDGSMPDPELSYYISQTHFLIEQDGPRCRLQDGKPARDEAKNILPGGPVAPSTCGLSVDGEALAPRGYYSLAAGEEAEVVLAPGLREGGALSLHLSCMPDAFGAPECAGALLRRNDAIAEAYLPLWGAVDLGGVDAALRGWILSWDDVRFLLQEPSGEARALAVGRSFGPPETPVRVLPFSQRGI